jgi:hypothetical protein
LRVATISWSNPHPVEARGYPRAAKEDEGPRALTPAFGRLMASDRNHPLRFGVDTFYLPNEPHADWPGMSGSVVSAVDAPGQEEIWIYGLVQAVPEHFNGQLNVARLADAWQADKEFRHLLVTAGVADEDAEDPLPDLTQVWHSVPVTHKIKIEKFVESYLGTKNKPVPFGGRQKALAELSGWLSEQTAPRHLLVTAPAGRGKTALIVHWMQLIPSRWKVAFVPISIRFQTNHASIFYEAMAYQLARIAGHAVGATHRDPGEFYRDRCLELLHAIDEKGVPTVVIVDGLDEASGWEIDLTLLGSRPDSMIRIVVSARTLAGDRDGCQGWLHRLDWAAGQQSAQCILIPPLLREGIEEALQSMGYPVASLATRIDIIGILERLTEGGDPLLVRMYAESLWNTGEASQRITPEELERLDPGYGGFFKSWFEKQTGNWSDANSPFRRQLEAVLAVLSVALGPIEHRHLEEICKIISRDQVISFSTKDIEPIRRFLLGDGRENGYSLQHPKFGTDFKEEYFLGGNIIADAEHAITTWAKGIVSLLNKKTIKPGNVPSYVLENYVGHLVKAADNAEAMKSLLLVGWERAWFERDGGYARYATEIAALMDAFREVSNVDPGRRLTMRVQCGLILSSIRSIGVNTPSELLAALVRCGKMSSRQALHRLQFQDAHSLAHGSGR